MAEEETKGAAATRASGKPKTTRLPVAPDSLKPTYEERKTASRQAATIILQAILDADIPVNKSNWDEKKVELDERCDWRTTYAPHLADLFKGHRQAGSGGAKSSEIAKKDKEIAKLLAGVAERDEKIDKLEERVRQLEWDNGRMSRGTRERRRRKPVQGRQSGNADTGSEASAT